MGIVIGGVSHLYQGDLDLARTVLARLRRTELPPGTAVEDFDYGAVAAAQRLQELGPSALVLVGTAQRGREAGSVERRRVRASELSRGTIQDAVADAVTGHIGLDILLEVAAALGALPDYTVAVYVEPLITGPSERLSAPCEGAITDVVGLVLAEVCDLEHA